MESAEIEVNGQDLAFKIGEWGYLLGSQDPFRLRLRGDKGFDLPMAEALRGLCVCDDLWSRWHYNL